jgi:hypothetical protein
MIRFIVGGIWKNRKKRDEIDQRTKDRKKGIENGYYPHIQMPKMHFYKMHELSERAKELAMKAMSILQNRDFHLESLLIQRIMGS